MVAMTDVGDGGSAAGKMAMTEGRKSDRTALLLTQEKLRPVETLIAIRMSERINKQQPDIGWAQRGGDYHKRFNKGRVWLRSHEVRTGTDSMR